MKNRHAYESHVWLFRHASQVSIRAVGALSKGVGGEPGLWAVLLLPPTDANHIQGRTLDMTGISCAREMSAYTANPRYNEVNGKAKILYISDHPSEGKNV